MPEYPAGGNASTIQGVPVSSTPPTPGQVLEDVGGVWTPQTGGGSGGVGSVTATNLSVIVNNANPAAPTVGTGTLDAIATAEPPVNPVNLNGQRATNAANGSTASDLATVAQLPVVTTTAPKSIGPAAIGASGKWADGVHVHSLVNGGVTLGTNTSLSPSGLTLLTTPVLQPGTYVVLAQLTVENTSGTAHNADAALTMGTATGAFTGGVAGSVSIPGTSGDTGDISVAGLFTVTGAGTIILEALGPVTLEAVISTPNALYSPATGLIYFQVA